MIHRETEGRTNSGIFESQSRSEVTSSFVRRSVVVNVIKHLICSAAVVTNS